MLGTVTVLRRYPVKSMLGEDLDALEEFTQGYEGPLKVQAVGPWTLAASLDLPIGGRMKHKSVAAEMDFRRDAFVVGRCDYQRS